MVASLKVWLASHSAVTPIRVMILESWGLACFWILDTTTIVTLSRRQQVQILRRSITVAKTGDCQYDDGLTMLHTILSIFVLWGGCQMRLALALVVPHPFAGRHGTTARAVGRLAMAPKYIKDKWVPQGPNDEPSAGYDIWGTLLRQGPKPALTRMFQADEYEQAVLKFMAGDNCDRNTAQGNMDAYLRNPQDWQFARLEDKKRGEQRDYVTVKSQDIVLVLVWSTIVSAFLGRAIYSIANGVDFVRTRLWLVNEFECRVCGVSQHALFCVICT
jgi:hypothetical protein